MIFLVRWAWFFFVLQLFSLASGDTTITADPTAVTVSRGDSSGRVIATVSASDGTEPYTYTLESQDPTSTPTKFTVDATSGEVTITADNSLDEDSYKLVVKAEDKAETATTDTIDITVTVTNNNRPVFGQSTYTACVNKDSTASTQVLVITATDADDDTISYGIKSGNIDSAFELESSTGAIAVANDKTITGTTNPYTLICTATDDDEDNPLSTQTTVSITVGDPCENSNNDGNGDNGGNGGAIFWSFSVPLLIMVMLAFKLLILN